MCPAYMIRMDASGLITAENVAHDIGRHLVCKWFDVVSVQLGDRLLEAAWGLRRDDRLQEVE
ncbi:MULTISPECIES: hypothetical protein [unclassified Mesorhizobium]|uniref:hypothetical protein n=1 Tax=unclassified Mesorhizobium TaxID=325217 RepID=UPI001CCB55FA|nr:MULTISPECIES: hypothetical protein [unclassified Mesorhizobium]MBZ9811308.1 hypothetical protein [Mesorhizobium sp. ESP-6-2]